MAHPPLPGPLTGRATCTGESRPSGTAHGQQRSDETLLACIEACFDCAQSCVACADACLGEADPKSLARCIRLNQDCANVCETTGKILSRQTALERQMGTAMLQACMAACRRCEDACNQVLAAA